MRSIRLLACLLCAFLMANPAHAQLSDYGFIRDFSVTVQDSALKPLSRAWTGGMNSCHYNEIDIDLDGLKDLVVFDKMGDKISCYKNLGIQDSISYTYVPEWEYLFPAMSGWMQLKDYNCDGKEDIFAYAPAGIQVWENVSDTILKFRLITLMLNSYQGAGYSNISLTYVDYPGIVDLDGDGDLDILVFFGLGAYVVMHRNNSMELYGNCDTLLYERTFDCWGDFAESAATNNIILDIDCPWKNLVNSVNQFAKANAKHTGSTMLLLDVNNDSVQDLVLGDVDYMNLILLTNVGTKDTAHIGSADTLFPSESLPVNLVSFPVASYIDINNDSLKDLIVSPFDPNAEVPESYHSNWLYKNIGAPGWPVFSWESGDFLQGDMIDVGTGAYPVLFDADGDGLDDLIVSDYGYLDSTYYEFGYLKTRFRSQLSYYRNTGTASTPAYALVSRDYAGLSQLGYQSLLPAFADLDGDGDKDMLCGEKTGSLLYFENTAGAGMPAVFANPVVSYQGIDVGDAAAPAFVDINGDGLFDLVCGKKNGMLSYYRNTGSASNPVFVLENDSLGKVNVTNYVFSYSGYSTPNFYKSTAGFLKLFVGSENGEIHYYKDIEANLNGTFTAEDSILICIGADSVIRSIKEGYRTSIAVDDLNDDGLPEAIVGNYRGGLSWFNGRKPLIFGGVEEQAITAPESLIRVFPNPADEYILISTENITGNLAMYFVLTDISGRLIMETNVLPGQLNRLNTEGLQSGMYLYRLKIDTQMQSGKIVISH
jgi:hypothetical protein